MTDITSKQEHTPATHKKNGLSKACRYFKKGFCGCGEKCSYRHSEPKSRSRFSSNNISDVGNCLFYEKASCKFASKCWNKHIRPNGKEYPKPGPLNKFIVVGPSGEESNKTEDTPSPVKDSAASVAFLAQETGIRRNFKRPQNQDGVSNCFYYEKKGTCCYGDKCWYSHSEPYAHPADELHEANPEPELEPQPDHTKMCYNFIFTECEFGDECAYVHGDICQFCDLPFLHPFDVQQRNEHLEACEMFFLEDMDNAFKFMISKDKMCAICLEYVWGPDKLFTKQKFGIQEKCNHIFCLHCIRRWRDVKRKSSQPKLCPACREESLVVVPCARWFESEKEKEQWIEDYKAAIAHKPCKFYAKGKCENEHKCQYVHSGFLLPVKERQGGEDNWEDFESNNQLPSGEQEGPDNLATEDVTDDRDQQNAGWQNVQEQDFLDETSPENETNEDLDLLSSEQVISSNLADEYQIDGSLGQVNIVDDGEEQNVERQVLQDPEICDDTPENQPNEDLLLQSSERISPRNLAETTAQQFDDNLEHVYLVDVDEKQDVER